MEWILNFAWIAMAALMLMLWMSHAPQMGACRRTQLVALAVVILIMFPVISVTDDLLAAQITAETDGSQRKDHVGAPPHYAPHTTTNLILPVYMQLSDTLRFAKRINLASQLIVNPAKHSVLTRPPPFA
jgi:hypothetical protein